MLRFDEATYLYNVVPYSDGRILEICTDKGYATVDYKKMHFYPYIRKTVIPAYYVRKEDVLYLMKEEPQYYV